MVLSETVNWLRFSYDGEWIATVVAKQKEITFVCVSTFLFLPSVHHLIDKFRDGGSGTSSEDRWRGQLSCLASFQITTCFVWRGRRQEQRWMGFLLQSSFIVGLYASTYQTFPIINVMYEPLVCQCSRKFFPDICVAHPNFILDL